MKKKKLKRKVRGLKIDVELLKNQKKSYYNDLKTVCFDYDSAESKKIRETVKFEHDWNTDFEKVAMFGSRTYIAVSE